MFDIVRKSHMQASAITAPGYFDELRERIQRNTQSVIDYYRQESLSVESDHLLVQLLQAMRIEVNEHPFDLIERIDNNKDALARRYGINTPQRSAGLWTGGSLYGPNTYEGWVEADFLYDLTAFENNWPYVKPIRILRQPTSNPMPPALDSQREGPSGFAVIAIDLVALALQYRYWRSQVERRYEIARPTPNQFVLSYPLANSLSDHVDWAIFERLRRRINTNPLDELYEDWPFRMESVYNLLKRYIDDRFDHILTRRQEFEEILGSVKLIYREDAFELTRALPGARTHQIEWLHWFYQAPALNLLFKAQHEQGGDRSTHHRREIHEKYEHLWQNRQLESLVGPGFILDFENDIRQNVGVYL